LLYFESRGVSFVSKTNIFPLTSPAIIKSELEDQSTALISFSYYFEAKINYLLSISQILRVLSSPAVTN